MKNYKIIILGAQCSGKTTLARYLRHLDQSLPIIEEDELFVELNGGQYPQDLEYKEKTVRPQLDERIRESDDIIFLTSYCNLVLLQELKSKGFKVVQLFLSQEEFKKRNEKRMREEGYDDASVWAKEIFNFHDQVKSEGWADMTVDASQSVEKVGKEILDFIGK